MTLTNIFLLVFVAFVCETVKGHGMAWEPLSRASRWRFNNSAPVNYDDTQLFCGGFYVQHEVNKGRCGLCGDDFRQKVPRKHELGGPFGEGVIVRQYKQGEKITVQSKITANHLGYLYFDICNMDAMRNKGAVYEEEACFKRLTLSDGKDTWQLPSSEEKIFYTPLQLPEGLTCSHCVFRWTYVAGNNWGVCSDGTGALGCGIQEHFRTCSDISILQKADMSAFIAEEEEAEEPPEEVSSEA